MQIFFYWHYYYYCYLNWYSFEPWKLWRSMSKIPDHFPNQRHCQSSLSYENPSPIHISRARSKPCGQRTPTVWTCWNLSPVHKHSFSCIIAPCRRGSPRNRNNLSFSGWFSWWFCCIAICSVSSIPAVYGSCFGWSLRRRGLSRLCLPCLSSSH